LLGGDILRRKDDDILKRAHARRAERRSIQEQEATERWKWLAAAFSTRAQAKSALVQQRDTPTASAHSRLACKRPSHLRTASP
jgi:hypothetical protein